MVITTNPPFLNRQVLIADYLKFLRSSTNFYDSVVVSGEIPFIGGLVPGVRCGEPPANQESECFEDNLIKRVKQLVNLASILLIKFVSSYYRLILQRKQGNYGKQK